MNKDLLTVLNLSDNSNDAAVLAAVVALKDSNRTLGETNTGLKAKLDALELADKTAKTTEAVTLVDAAIASGTINDNAEKAVRKKWLDLFDKDYEGTKELLASLSPRKQVVKQIEDSKKPDSAELADLNAKSWDELDKSNKLVLLKDKYPEVFKQKYLQEFGKEANI